MDSVVGGLHIPSTRDEARRAERVLANVRCGLAVGCVAAVYFNSVVRFRAVALSCVLAYLVYSAVVLALSHAETRSDGGFLLAVHTADLVWALMVAIVTGGQSLLSLVLFLFALLAAAYRWGLLQVLSTAAASGALLLLASSLRPFSYGHSTQAAIRPANVVIEIVCLLTIGALIGYLADREKRLRARTTVSDHIIAKADPEAGIRETMSQVLGALMSLFGSRRVLLALHETATDRAFFWEARAGDGATDENLRSRELKDFERNQYFFATPGRNWCAVRLRRHRPDQAVRLLALGNGGKRLHNVSCAFPQSFFSEHAFRSLLALAFDLNGDWSGRLFLLDPGPRLDRVSDLRFLQALVQEIGPALHSTYLLWRLRSRIRRAEQARIARELHDEVVQSLIAAEMRVELLRRKAAPTSSSVAEELLQVRDLLHREVLCVRGLMQKLKSLEVQPEELLTSVADIVERFRCETGISAQLVAEDQKVVLPPRVCGEMARIVQEALVNVRKHSGAHNVLVRFASDRGLCKLVVQDDGRGFEFSGRLSQSDLEHLQKGPRVLQERVRSIRGELNIESVPGQGARLEICVPQKAYG